MAVRGAGVCVLYSCNTCLGVAAVMQGLRSGLSALGKPALRRRVPRHGDRAQSLKPAGNVPCTLFKASQKSTSLVQTPNHLCYTQEGMLGY